MADLSGFPITDRWPAQRPDAIQLYSLPTPNGVKASIMLGECGLDYDAHRIDIGDAAADQMTPEFLSLNPNNKTPVIVDEAVRVLRPGGRYAIHELGLQPDDLDDEFKTELRKNLARVIKVNARPLTVVEWTELLENAGLVVEWTDTAPMALLKMRRNLADEGLLGTLRIIKNALRDKEARRRMLAMRKLFNEHSDVLRGVALVARKPS